jgi:hypothetical protein
MFRYVHICNTIYRFSNVTKDMSYTYEIFSPSSLKPEIVHINILQCLPSTGLHPALHTSPDSPASAKDIAEVPRH